MTEYNYSERSTVGWHVFGSGWGYWCLVNSKIQGWRLLLETRSRACLKANLCHRDRQQSLCCVINLLLFLYAIITPATLQYQTTAINKVNHGRWRNPMESPQGRRKNWTYVSIKETKHLMMLTPLTAFQKLTKSFDMVNSSGDNTNVAVIILWKLIKYILPRNGLRYNRAERRDRYRPQPKRPSAHPLAVHTNTCRTSFPTVRHRPVGSPPQGR